MGRVNPVAPMGRLECVHAFLVQNGQFQTAEKWCAEDQLPHRATIDDAAPRCAEVADICISLGLWARLGLRWLQKAGGNILAMLNVRVLWTAQAYSQQINQGQREPY